MQAAMPGTLNGDSARAELRQLDSPTASASDSAGAPPTAPALAPVAGPPAPVEQLSAPAAELPTAPTPAALTEQPAESTLPSPVSQDSGTGEPEASPVPAATRPRKENNKTPDKSASSSSTDGGGGAVRISTEHANEMLATRLHFKTVHGTKLNNQGIVADALDHYFAYLRKKGALPPKA